MGRTLHYGITDYYSPNEIQALSLFILVHDYNTRYEWTAENIDLCEYRMYPNYEIINAKDAMSAEGILFNLVQQRIDQGLGFYTAVKSLVDEGFLSTRKKDLLKGFTKVSSNELNAHAVISFVIEASRLIPQTVFYLIDEGYATYCDLQIKNGLAKPHYGNIAEYLGNMDQDDKPNLSPKVDYLRQQLNSRPDYGNPSKYIRPLLNEGYLRERKQFQTKVLTGDNINQLGELMSQMASSEKEESAKYYEDINAYPDC